MVEEIQKKSGGMEVSAKNPFFKNSSVFKRYQAPSMP
jgi:hypothetical protein